jgi:hypothetical protein
MKYAEPSAFDTEARARNRRMFIGSAASSTFMTDDIQDSSGQRRFPGF